MNDCCTSSASRDKATVSTSATVPSLAVRPGVTFPDWSVVSSPVVKEALLAMVGLIWIVKAAAARANSKCLIKLDSGAERYEAT